MRPYLEDVASDFLLDAGCPGHPGELVGYPDCPYRGTRVGQEYRVIRVVLAVPLLLLLSPLSSLWFLLCLHPPSLLPTYGWY